MEHIVHYKQWKKIYEEVESQQLAAQQQALAGKLTQLNATAIDSEYWIDLAVDAVSGLIEMVPEIGTGLSKAVDGVHALSYIFRAVLTSSTIKKIEYFLLGIISIGNSFIPIGGNIANAAARVGIANALKLSPKILTKVPLIKNSSKITTWASTTPWKFDFLAVLVSHFKSEAISFIAESHGKITKIFDTLLPILKEWVSNWAVGPLVSNIITGLKSLYYTINDFKAYAPTVLKAADKVS